MLLKISRIFSATCVVQSGTGTCNVCSEDTGVCTNATCTLENEWNNAGSCGELCIYIYSCGSSMSGLFAVHFTMFSGAFFYAFDYIADCLCTIDLIYADTCVVGGGIGTCVNCTHATGQCTDATCPAANDWDNSGTCSKC